MIKACIFDLDGTIADTVESIAHAVNKVLEHFGLPIRPVEAFNFYAGDGFDMAVQRALLDAGDTELRYLQEGIRLGRGWFAEDPLYHVKPYDQMPETLQELRKHVPIAVCSNKPHEEAIHVVESIYGKGFFHRIQGQTDTIPKKPAPDGALAIAKALGAKPEECLYFGDTNTDMKTGLAAGMYTVGVTWGFRPRTELIENGAMRLLDRPEEILDVYREQQEK